jgi:DNA excision repair protein ERCC-2
MVSFPFSGLRPGQDKIINAIQGAVANREKLMLHASTGMGKTAPVLYAALLAAKESGLRIIFLTAKHTHQSIVYDTLRKMNNASNEKITFTGINGKRSMCLFENNVEPQLFTEFCRAVREQGMCDFYRNTLSKTKEIKPRALEALSEGISDPESVMAAGRKFEVCPYELSILNARNSDVIIANYMHVFDSGISGSFMSKVGIAPEKTIMVIDEAHNLHSRIIDMNSFSISERTLEKAYEEALAAKELALASKIDVLISKARSVTTEALLELDGIFRQQDMETISSIVEANEKGYNVPASFTLGKFVTLLLKADESYVKYASNEGGRIKINISSLDPSAYAGSAINSFYSSILISGTFKPMDTFADLLGIPDAKKVVIEDETLKNNRVIINETDITTKFTSRALQFGLIAERIDELLNGFKHNSIVFFPSYSFMGSIFDLLQHKDGVIKESPKLDREEKQRIISTLSKPGKCLFAVIGGNFSESIGVKNNIVRLIVIVGVPFEPPSIRLKALQAYYEKKFSKGFEYAQILPSMVKTMQAAGRGIRSAEDRAIVLLMDSRFRSSAFTKYLPEGIKIIEGGAMDTIRQEGFG